MNYIGGNWEKGLGATYASINPRNETILWEGNYASKDQIKSAIDCASEAHFKWSSLSFKERLEIIKNFYNLLEKNAQTVSEIIALETGKVDHDAESEVSAARAKLKNVLDAYEDRTGAKKNVTNIMETSLTHHSLGVVCVIGPFNFPLHLPNGQITPSLLAGNTVIFKPSESTPLISEYMMMLWEEAGIPKGVINLLHGKKWVVQNLVKHSKIKGIFFTGGYDAGRSIHASVSGEIDKLVALELGGINPIVVWNTNKIQQVKNIILESAFISTGQRCTCARKLILPKNKYGKKILDSIKKDLGDPSITNHFLGPLISNEARLKVISQQKKLEKIGARIIKESKVPKGKGFFITPGLIDSTNLKERFDEEIFGPILQVHFVGSFSEAIDEANNTKFGLAASLISDSRPLFDEFHSSINSGLVNFNATTTGASGALPFGGVGKSGNYRPAGFYAADFCAWPKSSVLKKL